MVKSKKAKQRARKATLRQIEIDKINAIEKKRSKKQEIYNQRAIREKEIHEENTRIEKMRIEKIKTDAIKMYKDIVDVKCNNDTGIDNYWENVKDILNSHLNSDVTNIILDNTKDVTILHSYDIFFQKLKKYGWFKTSFYRDEYIHLLMTLVLYELFKQNHIECTLNRCFLICKSDGNFVSDKYVSDNMDRRDPHSYHYWLTINEKSYNIAIDIANNTWGKGFNINAYKFNIQNADPATCWSWNSMWNRIRLAHCIQDLYENNPDNFWENIAKKILDELEKNPKKTLEEDFDHQNPRTSRPVLLFSRIIIPDAYYPEDIIKIEDIDIRLMGKIKQFRNEILTSKSIS